MAGINLDQSTKEEFDELQPDDTTQSEFVEKLLAAYRRDNGEVVNPDEIAAEIVKKASKKVASASELGAYRGTRDALEEQ